MSAICLLRNGVPAMRTLNVMILGLALPLITLAGCIDDGADILEGDLGDVGAAVPLFGAETKNCREGGGVSMYNYQEPAYLIDPYFEYEDILGDNGNPMIMSYGRPNTNPVDGAKANGIWHMTVVCDEYSYMGEKADGPLKMGWVGQRVKAPAWDTSGIERQYFIADFDFSDERMVDDIIGLTGLHASYMIDGFLEWPAPNLLHQMLEDSAHGKFETRELMKDFGKAEARGDVIRFWFAVEANAAHGHDEGEMGGEPGLPAEGAHEDTPLYRPMAIDMYDTYHPDNKAMVIDNVRLLLHVFGPEETLQGNAGHQGIFGGATYYEGFDRKVVLADVEAPLIDKSWFH